MTQKHEQMSAFMDGELPASSVIDSVGEESELRDKWNRYHLARSVMRNELPDGKLIDISASVAAALDAEPVVLAPNATKSNSLFSQFTAKVIPFAKQSGQFAVAASVAAAVIIGVQTYNKPDTTEPFTTLATGAPQGGLAPVSLNQTRVLPLEEEQSVIETRRQIQALINDHEQQIKLRSVKAETSSSTSAEDETTQ